MIVLLDKHYDHPLSEHIEGWEHVTTAGQWAVSQKVCHFQGEQLIVSELSMKVLVSLPRQ